MSRKNGFFRLFRISAARLSWSSLFFNVIDIKPDVNGVTGRNTLRDIVLKKFLKLDREIADSLSAHVVIPLNDFAALVRIGFVSDPLFNRLVIRTGGHKLPERCSGQSGKIEKEVIQGAVEFVFPKLVSNGCPAFVEGPGGDNVAGESLVGAARIIAWIGKIRVGHFDDCHLLFSWVKPPLSLQGDPFGGQE